MELVRARSRNAKALPAVSMAHVLERMGLDQVGTHGTTAALALLNDAVKRAA